MHLATWHLHPPSISRKGSSSKPPLVLQALDACVRARVHARFYVSRQSAYARFSCVFLASAYMKWDGNAERRVKRAKGMRKRERKRQKVEENFDVRSYAIAWGEGAPGPSFPCAPKSPHCLLRRDSIGQQTVSSLTYTEVPFCSVSFSSYLRCVYHRDSSITFETGAYFRVRFFNFSFAYIYEFSIASWQHFIIINIIQGT